MDLRPLQNEHCINHHAEMAESALVAQYLNHYSSTVKPAASTLLLPSHGNHSELQNIKMEGWRKLQSRGSFTMRGSVAVVWIMPHLKWPHANAAACRKSLYGKFHILNDPS